MIPSINEVQQRPQEKQCPLQLWGGKARIFSGTRRFLNARHETHAEIHGLKTARPKKNCKLKQEKKGGRSSMLIAR